MKKTDWRARWKQAEQDFYLASRELEGSQLALAVAQAVAEERKRVIDMLLAIALSTPRPKAPAP